MATGVKGAELFGIASLTAAKPHVDPHPLPGRGSIASLDYPHKLPEEEILRPFSCSFTRFQGQKEFDQANIEANAFVLADNFFALHQLIESGRRPRLIYFDPPYATGMEFQSRQLERAYKDSWGPAAYLEFIRRRLVLMRELLADDGSIYVHIGHQMLCQIKILLDEVLGANNFRNLIVRRKCSSKNFTRNQYPNLHDYILFYTKSSSYCWNRPTEDPTDDWLVREYDHEDSRGRYKMVPVHAPGVRHGETGQAWRGVLPPPGKHWQFAPSKLDELDAQGEIHWSKNGNPRRKVYLTPDKRVSLTDYWGRFRDAHHQSIAITGYPTEKNLEMMKIIIEASSDPGDLVIDPFCGSGTTLDAANQLGRRWIGIDELFAAAKATLKRLRHGLAPMGDYVRRNKKASTDTLFEVLPIQEAPEKRRSLPVEFNFLVDSELVAHHYDQIRKLGAISHS